MASKDKAAQLQKYEGFINDKFKPKLQALLDARDEVYSLLSEYQKLKKQIQLIKDNNLTELKSMVDLGSQFYAQALVPDTQYIFVNVGFGFHVQFTLDEALAFIDKKEKRLNITLDKYTQDADEVRAHIKMALGVMSDILEGRA